MAETEWMTDDEFCAEARVPTSQRYRRMGTGPAFYRLPGGIRYRRSDVENWFAARRHPA
jgi:hypothetical protein